MAKSHGAKEQKRLAKKKARQAAKRSFQIQRESKDPAIRLKGAEKWPIVKALVSDTLWTNGIGHLVIARRESKERLVFAVFLVDVYCLGVKNAFWQTGFEGDLHEIVKHIAEAESVSETTPAALAKILEGAVDYAASLGFPPHRDYRRAAMLLAGVDSSTCREEFTFGMDGKPFYFRGPNESLTEAKTIGERVVAAGGDFMIQVGKSHMAMVGADDDFDEDEIDEIPAPDDEDDLVIDSFKVLGPGQSATRPR